MKGAIQKAEELAVQIGPAEARWQTGLMIAHAYACLGAVDDSRRFLKQPPLPQDPAGYNRYLQYVSILAAAGEYAEIEQCITRLESPEAAAAIRSYVVYYDALLARKHLQQSLPQAAAGINEASDPNALFSLALGYQMAGNTVQARKACLLSGDSYTRFVACSYMAATLGMAGKPEQAAFYLDQAENEKALFAEGVEADPYTLMIYGRALAFAGRIEQATRIYTQLSDEIDALYVGAVIASELRDAGHADVAQTIIGNAKANAVRLRKTTDRPDYLSSCYGDFLITLGLFRDFDAELKQSSDPLQGANLLTGAAQALADEIVYRQ